MKSDAVRAALIKLKRRGEAVLRLLRRWTSGYEVIEFGRLPGRLQPCPAGTCPACAASAGARRPSRLVYLVPGSDTPCGGNKVIYRHVELAQAAGLAVEVLHPERPAGFRFSWFEHALTPLANARLCRSTDHLVLPEAWAALGDVFCRPHGFSYSIFVQNGYLLHHTAGFPTGSLRAGYDGASQILAISEDSAAMVSRVFPWIPPGQVCRVVASVSDRFTAGPRKFREITYMPRKVPMHAQRLEAFLAPLLPEGWSLVKIDRATEAEVIRRLARSAIFLCFSDLEGLGLPPIEAALAGNRVVGYHGQGGKEFFQPPLFYPVEFGDLGAMIDQTLAAIRDFERDPQGTEAMAAQRAALAERYGAARERALALEVQRRLLGGASPAA